MLVFWVLCITSCIDDPKPTIDEEKAVKIFTDISLADQVVNLYPPDQRDSIRIILTESLLKIHNVTQSELDTNLYLYMSDFERFGPLTDLMIERFDSLSNKFNK